MAMIETTETPEDVERLLEKARAELKAFEDAVDGERLLARVKRASPAHPVLLARALFMMAGVLFLIMMVVVIAAALFNRDAALFLSGMQGKLGIPGGFPVVFIGLSLCMFIAYIMATFAARSIGRETPMLQWEAKEYQKLVNEVTRLTTQKAVMERIRGTPGGARPRIATPVPMSMRGRGPSSPPSTGFGGGFGGRQEDSVPPYLRDDAGGGGGTAAGGFGSGGGFGNAPGADSAPSPAQSGGFGGGGDGGFGSGGFGSGGFGGGGDNAAAASSSDSSFGVGLPPTGDSLLSRARSGGAGRAPTGGGGFGGDQGGGGFGSGGFGSGGDAGGSSGGGFGSGGFGGSSESTGGFGSGSGGFGGSSGSGFGGGGPEESPSYVEFADDPPAAANVPASGGFGSGFGSPSEGPSFGDANDGGFGASSSSSAFGSSGGFGSSSSSGFGGSSSEGPSFGGSDRFGSGSPSFGGTGGFGSPSEEPDDAFGLVEDDSALGDEGSNTAGIRIGGATRGGTPLGARPRAGIALGKSRLAAPMGFPGTPEPSAHRDTVDDYDGEIMEDLSYGAPEEDTAPPRVGIQMMTARPMPAPQDDLVALGDIVETTAPGAIVDADDVTQTMGDGLPKWGRIDEMWLEEAIEKAENMVRSFPEQASLAFSVEQDLPFTLVIERATPAMAVRAMVSYVEFLASIYTPKRARIELRKVAHLDRSFHRNVDAALQPYFAGKVTVENHNGIVEIEFADPDPGWDAYPMLPME